MEYVLTQQNTKRCLQNNLLITNSSSNKARELETRPAIFPHLECQIVKLPLQDLVV